MGYGPPIRSSSSVASGVPGGRVRPLRDEVNRGHRVRRLAPLRCGRHTPTHTPTGTAVAHAVRGEVPDIPSRPASCCGLAWRPTMPVLTSIDLDALTPRDLLRSIVQGEEVLERVREVAHRVEDRVHHALGQELPF